MPRARQPRPRVGRGKQSPMSSRILDAVAQHIARSVDGARNPPEAPPAPPPPPLPAGEANNSLDSGYRLGPDSLPQHGVPRGEIRGPYVLPCDVFPGTQHTYWVYVPAQYQPAEPAVRP